MIVLVCGSREWTDEHPIHVALTGYHAAYPGALTVVEGGARGADRIAGRWAAQMRQHGVGWLRVPADWKAHGNAAGPIRNQQMLEYLSGYPAVVLAFKDGFDRSLARGGTEDMVRRAREAVVPTYVVSH